MWQSNLNARLIQCFFCDKNAPLSTYRFQKTLQIYRQHFFLINCSQCQGLNYFWKIDNQYFFQRKIHLVLHQPEIIGNVGTIIRLAVAFNLPLHLIEPFGFIFSESWLKRSSANHFNLAKIQIYADWKEFVQTNDNAQLILTSAHGNKSLSEFDFTQIHSPIYLVFGCESKGLPNILKKQYSQQLIYIKQNITVRSINLANAVSIFAVMVLHQYRHLGL